MDTDCRNVYGTDGMPWREAFRLMLDGEKLQLPGWGGFWAWEDGTVMMHDRDGSVLNILDTKDPEIVFSDIASTLWRVATDQTIHIAAGPAHKLRVMISQPMHGLTEPEILATRYTASSWLRRIGYDVVDTYFTDFPAGASPLAYLARSLDVMSTCDAVFFCDGWNCGAYPGCEIEHSAAQAYGLIILSAANQT